MPAYVKKIIAVQLTRSFHQVVRASTCPMFYMGFLLNWVYESQRHAFITCHSVIKFRVIVMRIHEMIGLTIAGVIHRFNADMKNNVFMFALPGQCQWNKANLLSDCISGSPRLKNLLMCAPH